MLLWKSGVNSHPFLTLAREERWEDGSVRSLRAVRLTDVDSGEAPDKPMWCHLSASEAFLVSPSSGYLGTGFTNLKA